MNHASFLSRTAGEQGARTVLRLGEGRASYADLDEAGGRVAGLLADLGIGSGDWVGIMFGNTPDFAAAYYPGGVTAVGVPIDLSSVSADSYIVAGITDHITPWQNCYCSTHLLGGETRFVLSTSGHIAALVNPPTNLKASHRVNTHTPRDAEEWLATADTRPGSWWPDFAGWLCTHCGSDRPAPTELGGGRHRPLTEAPGTYVFEN